MQVTAVAIEESTAGRIGYLGTAWTIVSAFLSPQIWRLDVPPPLSAPAHVADDCRSMHQRFDAGEHVLAEAQPIGSWVIEFQRAADSALLERTVACPCALSDWLDKRRRCWRRSAARRTWAAQAGALWRQETHCRHHCRRLGLAGLQSNSPSAAASWDHRQTTLGSSDTCASPLSLTAHEPIRSALGEAGVDFSQQRSRRNTLLSTALIVALRACRRLLAWPAPGQTQLWAHHTGHAERKE